MKIKLLLFGVFTDIFNKNRIEINLPNSANVSDLKNYIIKNYPKTIGLNFAVAIDEAYATNDEIIKENQVVALIPPVSGG